ncbi:MAG: APC family permease [Coriobacteriia bacterium]
MAKSVKNLLLGDPLHNEESEHQRLSNFIALAVFSSDAISSVAYATGEIIITLSLAGAAFLGITWPIALAIGALILIVGTSYRQTIRAYPNGGGSYIVAKENLGNTPGLFAGASLLVDYTLTVAVSIAAGTEALTSAFPDLRPYSVPITLVLLGILALGNLRGVRESGAIFSVPTYAFILLIVCTITWGVITAVMKGTGALVVPSSQEAIVGATGTIGVFLVLRAFASGCAALSGIEAIANGVTQFRNPAPKNASKTLTRMMGIMLFLFLGISWLAVKGGVRHVEAETVISQIARNLFGTSLLYYLVSFATMAILVVAANTSYSGFPLLSSFMASDDFMPHQLKDKGYRLVHSNGIILLTVAAGSLLIIFQARTSHLIPLYALGVFSAFTLSQAGMVKHWLANKQDPHWRFASVVNGVGACVTGLVLVVIAIAKFTQGAWIVVLFVPLLVLYFSWVRRRYALVHAELALSKEERVDLNWQAYNKLHNHVIVLVKDIDRRLVRALQYARTLRADSTEAVFVDLTGKDAERIRREWDEADFGVKLTIVPSPYREMIRPFIDYIHTFPRPDRDHIVTVIVPEYAPTNVADAVLHDQTSRWLKQQLFGEEGVIVTDVPYHPSFDEETRRIAASAG